MAFRHSGFRHRRVGSFWIIRYHFRVTSLVRSPRRNDDDPDGRRARLAGLEALLGARVTELAAVKADLGAFEIDYRKRVGTLHEQLERLELAIAEAELGELSRRLETGSGGPSQPPAGVRPAMPTPASV